MYACIHSDDTCAVSVCSPWCWVRAEESPGQALAWRLGLFYASLWVAVLAILLAYVRLLSVMRDLRASAASTVSPQQLQGLRQGVHRVLAYAAILTLCYALPTVNRLVLVNQPDEQHPYWIKVVQSVMTGSVSPHIHLSYRSICIFRNSDKAFPL